MTDRQTLNSVVRRLQGASTDQERAAILAEEGVTAAEARDHVRELVEARRAAAAAPAVAPESPAFDDHPAGESQESGVADHHADETDRWDDEPAEQTWDDDSVEPAGDAGWDAPPATDGGGDVGWVEYDDGDDAAVDESMVEAPHDGGQQAGWDDAEAWDPDTDAEWDEGAEVASDDWDAVEQEADTGWLDDAAGDGAGEATPSDGDDWLAGYDDDVESDDLTPEAAATEGSERSYFPPLDDHAASPDPDFASIRTAPALAPPPHHDPVLEEARGAANAIPGGATAPLGFDDLAGSDGSGGATYPRRTVILAAVAGLVIGLVLGFLLGGLGDDDDGDETAFAAPASATSVTTATTPTTSNVPAPGAVAPPTTLAGVPATAAPAPVGEPTPTSTPTSVTAPPPAVGVLASSGGFSLLSVAFGGTDGSLSATAQIRNDSAPIGSTSFQIVALLDGAPYATLLGTSPPIATGATLNVAFSSSEPFASGLGFGSFAKV